MRMQRYSSSLTTSCEKGRRILVQTLESVKVTFDVPTQRLSWDIARHVTVR
jgi:hypothetical protein